jgi:hypothetical protein
MPGRRRSLCYIWSFPNVLPSILKARLQENNCNIARQGDRASLAPIEDFVVRDVQFYIDGDRRIFAINKDLLDLADTVRQLIVLPLLLTKQEAEAKLPDKGRSFYNTTCMQVAHEVEELTRHLVTTGIIQQPLSTHAVSAAAQIEEEQSQALLPRTSSAVMSSQMATDILSLVQRRGHNQGIQRL